MTIIKIISLIQYELLLNIQDKQLYMANKNQFQGIFIQSDIPIGVT